MWQVAHLQLSAKVSVTISCLLFIDCLDPSLLRCIVLSFDAFESSAYQLKIVSQDATPSSYCLIADQRYGSVFSANIHVIVIV